MDGTDLFASVSAMREAVDYVRARKGPAFVHAHVVRPYSHSLSDDEKLYKTPTEREGEARRDPIVRLAEFLRANGLVTDNELTAIAADVDHEIADVTGKALQAPKPAKETAALWVYSPDVDRPRRRSTAGAPEGKPETMVTAINRTLKDETAHDPRIVVFGEDVETPAEETLK